MVVQTFGFVVDRIDRASVTIASRSDCTWFGASFAQMAFKKDAKLGITLSDFRCFGINPIVGELLVSAGRLCR
jgi:hypothetical protein